MKPTETAARNVRDRELFTLVTCVCVRGVGHGPVCEDKCASWTTLTRCEITYARPKSRV